MLRAPIIVVMDETTRQGPCIEKHLCCTSGVITLRFQGNTITDRETTLSKHRT